MTPSDPTRRAVVLLSGGLDSATVLAMARSQGFETHAVSFRYGQRHERELEAAARVARALGAASHRVVSLDLRAIGGSALTTDTPVPRARSVSQIGQGIPVTYVPARNTIFLSLALGLAEVIGATDLFVGVNAVDYSGYPDCRPEYLAAFERLANLATRAGVEGARFRLHAPLLELTKGEIIRAGISLGLDYGITHSCYDPSPSGLACGSCDSCLLRLRGFADAGMADPVSYQPGSPD